jgi:predicted transglutaminase-like cysteine proteinase
MKNLKSNIILSTLVSAVALMATASNAAETNKLQEAYKSTNVKSALINVCKDETGKSKKLSSAEVSKYCTCAVEADGKLTNAQKWEIQSTINQKKSPATLAFVQKQNKDLQACFGPQLTGKLKSLTEEAMKSAQAKK